MLSSRFQGLLSLHGVLVIVTLLALFLVMAVLGVETGGHFDYSFINFPLYLGGIAAAGVIFFNFYPTLGGSLLRPDRARVFQVTNLQTFVLLLVLFGIIFATKDKAISRLFIGSFMLMAYGLLFIMNLFLPGYLSRMVLKGRNERKCLVIGATTTCGKLEPWLQEKVLEFPGQFSASCGKLEPWLQEKEALGLDVVGVLLPEPEAQPLEVSLPVLGTVDRLREEIHAREVNQIVLLETRQSKRWVQEVLGICEQEGCQMLVYNPWAEYFDHPLVSVKDGPHTFFTLSEEPLESPAKRMVKRLFDIVIALPIVFLVLPVLTLWVWRMQRKQSPGPVFFKQVRRGFNRREFTIYKYRTMHLRPLDDEATQARKEDPRVFPFGQFLRKTSLDELPQFWNVLKGDMSVVGPRPHLPEHDKLFARDVRVYLQRHFVKPGITGLAQCHGFRGEITDLEVLRRRVRYDLQYITEWSLWMDIEILFRTLFVVIKPPPTAY